MTRAKLNKLEAWKNAYLHQAWNKYNTGEQRLATDGRGMAEHPHKSKKNLQWWQLCHPAITKNQQCTTESFGSPSSGLQIPSIHGIKCFFLHPSRYSYSMDQGGELGQRMSCSKANCKCSHHTKGVDWTSRIPLVHFVPAACSQHHRESPSSHCWWS